MTKYWLIGLIALVGCNNIDPYDALWYDLEFEWVEPVIFQHNLMICRQSDVCLAETLFE